MTEAATSLRIAATAGVPDSGIGGRLAAMEQGVLADAGTLLRLPAGHTLFRRGDIGHSMYLVERGSVSLAFGEDLTSKSIGPGGYFGELGLLIGNHERSASATTETDCVLREIGRAAFDILQEREPAVLASFLRRAIVRVVDSEQDLIRNLRRRNRDLQDALDSLHDTRHQLSCSEELVHTDELTGVLNRRGVLRLFSGGSVGALLLVDCDDFKIVNDVHGHLGGDRLLQSFAQILQSVPGNAAAAGRLGGDEFCVLMEQPDAAGLHRVCTDLLEAARALNAHYRTPPIRTTLSIGASLVVPGETWVRACARADAALYRAKSAGGDGFVVHQDGMAVEAPPRRDADDPQFAAV